MGQKLQQHVTGLDPIAVWMEKGMQPQPRPLTSDSQHLPNGDSLLPTALDVCASARWHLSSKRV